MTSTGEVGCIGDTFNAALLSAMMSVGNNIPKKNILVSLGALKDKVELLDPCKEIASKGYVLYATAGTAKFLSDNGVKAITVNWPDEEGGEMNIMKMIAERSFDMIVNVPKDQTKRELTNGYRIRRAAIDHNIPLITNTRLASAFISAFCQMKQEDIQIKSWQEYSF